MKGLKHVANLSKTNNRLPLYYSFTTDTVYTESGKKRFFVTYLINENTTDDIKHCIERWKSL